MEWLFVGMVCGVGGVGISSWAHTKGIRIRWYIWIFAALAVWMATLTALDYATLIKAMEPVSAGVVVWICGGPALILALIAITVVWWQNRKSVSNSSPG
jgi:hypothetical protein